MCGIFGYKGNNLDAGNLVLEGLKKLEYRGYDSWGVAVYSSDREIIVQKQIGKIGEAKLANNLFGKLALGHTRWATHGGVTKDNAHPHLDCSKRFALVHNGIIENYAELKKSLKKKHRFLSETDSEVLVHLIEELCETHGFLDAVRIAFNKCTGLNSIVLIDSQTNTLLTVKIGSPIVLASTNKGGFIASDSSALIKYSRDLFFLEDKQMAVFFGHKLNVINVVTGKEMKPNFIRVDYNKESQELGDYRYYMLKEIYEQPRVLLQIAEGLLGEALKIAKIINDKEIIFLACGSSYHAGLFGKYLLKEIANKDSDLIYAHESFLLENLSKNKIVIAISQSGETIDLVESMKKVQGQKIKTISLVNVLGSTLYRMSDEKILLGAGPEIGVAATKSFLAQIGFLILLAFCLKGDLKKGKLILSNIAKAIDNILLQKRRIKTLSQKIKMSKSIFILGRKLNYPMALESALKIKEVSYIHAEGFAGGELKHGVIALVEKNTPCIILAQNDDTFAETISNAMEVKARGAIIIGISPKNNPVFDFWFPISDLKELSSIQDVVICQMIAYFLALSKNLDPDKPRNLAKSVVVK